MLLGIIPNVPGFLAAIKLMKQDAMWLWVTGLYHYAWFVGFFVSGMAYLLMMKKERAPESERAAPEVHHSPFTIEHSK